MSRDLDWNAIQGTYPSLSEQLVVGKGAGPLVLSILTAASPNSVWFVDTSQDDVRSLHGDAGYLHRYAASLHGDVRSLHGDAGSLHGDAGSLHGDAGCLQRYAASLHRYVASLHGDAGSLHWYAGSLHSDAGSLRRAGTVREGVRKFDRQATCHITPSLTVGLLLRCIS